MPRRFATPGRKPSMTTCVFWTSRWTTSRAAGFFRSIEKLRLLRFSVSNWTGTYERPGSPFGISTLMTSAPRSASIAEANGPGTNIEKSTTRIPARGSQGSARSFKVGRRVHDQHFCLFARHGEYMQHAGGEKAGFARLHFEFLLADLDVRRAFEQVADLLDPGMQVRVRALALFDFTDEHFHVPRA